MTPEKLVEALDVVSNYEVKLGCWRPFGYMYPKRWADSGVYRCVDGHVFHLFLISEAGEHASTCSAGCVLTFPEDTAGPLKHPALLSANSVWPELPRAVVVMEKHHSLDVYFDGEVVEVTLVEAFRKRLSRKVHALSMQPINMPKFMEQVEVSFNQDLLVMVLNGEIVRKNGMWQGSLPETKKIKWKIPAYGPAYKASSFGSYAEFEKFFLHGKV